MATLSLAMIVKDEEESLAGVLADAAAFCDEIVVVDTGSTDASRSIAESAGARVLDFAWIDDFAAARNYAFDACASDWIIWLDADDRVRPVVQDAMRRAKDEVLGDDVDAVFTPYRYHFAPGTDICTYSFNRERLIRRGSVLRWEGAVHEVISAPYGRHTFREDLYIEHRPSQAKRARVGNRNLRILQRVYDDGDRTPRTLFYYANELRDNGRQSEALQVYEQYLQASDLLWEKHAALLNMATCAQVLGKAEDARDYALRAIVVDASRAEGWIRVGRFHYDREEWAQAIPFFVAASSLTRPGFGFVDDADYTWRPYDYLSICHDKVGRKREAIDSAIKALDGNPERERIVTNLHFMVQAL